MMPYSAYQLYQAERVKSEAEQRQADVRLGMMAAEVSRLWGKITRPVRPLRTRNALDYCSARYADSDLAACEGTAA